MRGLLLLALCMLACTASSARTLTVDDLLRIESFGQVELVPGRDLLLVEHRLPYASAADFGYDTYFNSRMVTRVLATSIAAPGPLAPLFPQSADAGYWIGSKSPGGTRVTVFRLKDRMLSLGIVDLASRAVVWLPSAPDLPTPAPAPAWIDEGHLLFVAMARPRLPGSLSAGTAGTSDVATLWKLQAEGGTTRTLVDTRTGAQPNAGERRLVLASTVDGAERVLATGDIVDLSLAPSRRRAAIVTAGEPAAPPAGPINAGFDSRRNRLAIVDLATGRMTAFTDEVLRGVMSWSREDRLLVVTRDGGSDWGRARWGVADPSGRFVRLGGAGDFAAVDEVAAGRLAGGGWAGSSPIARIRGEGGAPRWARLHEARAKDLPLGPAARAVGATAAVKWLLDGASLYAVDERRVGLVARGVEQAGPVLPDPYARGFRLVRDPDTLPLVVSSTSPGSRTIRPVDGVSLGSGIAIDAKEQVLAASDDVAVVVRADLHSVTDLFLVRRGRSPVRLAQLNAGLSTVELPRAIDLKGTGPGGETFHDWLLLPASGAKPPLVVNPYPGLKFTGEAPREAGISRFAIPDNALLLVSAGYAVLLPSMPLTGTGNPADAILPRIDAATDAAVATGLVDGERVGVQGHSFGGYAALTVATRSSRYRAIVAANGPYDLLATHGNMPSADKLRLDYGIPAAASIGWTEGGQGGIGGPPSEKTEAYLAASPMLRLDKVDVPILLIAGDLDPVDVTQAERAFMELYRHGKDASLARYWGEGHANASAGNIGDYWRLIVDFFDRHLKSPR